MNNPLVTVLLFVESRYKLDRKRVKSTVEQVLGEQHVTGPVEVSIAFVGSRKMKELSAKYKGDGEKDRNILTFPLSEGVPTVMPTDKLRLGDIVISYPYVIDEAVKQEKLVDDWISELIEHGLMHLLGLHHE